MLHVGGSVLSLSVYERCSFSDMLPESTSEKSGQIHGGYIFPASSERYSC
uniref:Uncharacterized protein n=1 Tax=Arion vulgaris TaxID=1028688 RepID=A0A0B6YEK1_9EUPU